MSFASPSDDVLTGTDRCVFALQGASEAVARARLESLTSFYGGLVTDVSARWCEAAGTLVGSLSFRAGDRGGPLSAPRVDSEAWVLGWGDVPAGAERYPGRFVTSGMLIEQSQRQVDVVVGAASPVACFEGESAGCRAWASHAGAVAVLLGRARLDSRGLPQLLAMGYIGGEATLFSDVRKTPAASVTTITDGSKISRTTFLTPADRLARLRAGDASAHAVEHLLEAFASRGETTEPSWLGLTAGADSTVIAAALHAAGVRFRAYTWGGGTSDPDVAGAAATAAKLGIAHECLSGGWLEPDEIDAAVTTEALWSDGVTEPVLLGQPRYPSGHGAVITGAGGETGRAWHYRTLAACYRKPRGGQILRVWRPEMRLGGAEPAVAASLQETVRGWLETANQHGHHGWDALDFVYSEHRLRSWGRSMVPRVARPVVAGFGHPQVQRALMSLPLADKLSDGFHRAFLRDHLPSVSLPRPDLQRRGIPPVLRRVAARRRQRNPPALTWALQRAAADLIRDRFLDDVSRRPFISEAMGEKWASDLRRRFDGREDLAIEQALRLIPPAIIEDRL